MACSTLCQKIPRSPGLGITNVIDFLLEEVNPDSSLEGLLLKLKLRYFGHLMRIANSLEKTLIERLKAEGEEGNRA